MRPRRAFGSRHRRRRTLHQRARGGCRSGRKLHPWRACLCGRGRKIRQRSDDRGVRVSIQSGGVAGANSDEDSLDQARNSATASDSASRPELEALASNKLVTAWIDYDWARSNPYDLDPRNRHEFGFWILGDASGNISIQEFPQQGSFNSVSPGHMPGSDLLSRIINWWTGGPQTVAMFHTHPNPPAQSFNQGPDIGDINFSTRRGIGGIIQSHNGMYYYGP